MQEIYYMSGIIILGLVVWVALTIVLISKVAPPLTKKRRKDKDYYDKPHEDNEIYEDYNK
jgi:hypothetical protein